jgi:hypothetical protein
MLWETERERERERERGGEDDNSVLKDSEASQGRCWGLAPLL